MSTVKVTLNGMELEAETGSTILQVASKNGVTIPTFCYHPLLPVAASCRMCLVEIAGAPKLLPACQTEVRSGMTILTESPRVKDWQKRNLEFILLHHPVDCPICDAAGDCKLQNHYTGYDQEKSRLWSYQSKLRKSKRKIFGPHVMYDGERCILCTMCIRFCEHVWGEHLLDSRLRGNRREIIVAPGETLDFPYSLMTVELCPVGALTSRDFRFRKRCWFLASRPGICPGCATGCAAVMDHDEGVIYRMRPRFDPAVNAAWLCDDGVLAGELHNRGRVSRPMVAIDGARTAADHGEAVSAAAAILSKTPPEKLGVVLSAEATCEEDLALVKLAEGLGVTAFYLEGRPDGPDDRLLRSRDKNPNRAGALAMAARKGLPGRGMLIADLRSGKLKTLLCLGGEGPGPSDVPADAAIICIAAREGALTAAARVVLPAPSFAETSGTYVNARGMVRNFDVAISSWGSLAPPPQVAETIQAIAEGMGKTMPFSPDAARRDVAGKITRLPGEPG
jgi:NADH-quinone oxidoreductase subunit G